MGGTKKAEEKEVRWEQKHWVLSGREQKPGEQPLELKSLASGSKKRQPVVKRK